MKNLTDWLNSHLLIKHLVLVVSVIIIFAFIMNLTLNFFTRHNKYYKVPDFTGMTMDEAGRAAKKGSLQIEVYDERYMPEYDPGVILSQLPESGAEVKSGRRIFVTINSERQKMARIPYVTGVSLRQAKNNLEVAGFVIDKLIYQQDMATNYVLETRYGGKVVTAGSKIEAEQGSGITLVVGRNSEEQTTIVPKVIGFPLKEAQSRLWELGLNLGSAEFDEGVTLLNRNEARVYQQRPEQGSRVTLGTPVVLKLTTDTQKVEKGSSASDKDAKRIISQQQQEEEQSEQQENNDTNE